MPVLHSTKNLHVIEPPTPTRTGIFEYTDHYTVFHYGRMSDAEPLPPGEANRLVPVQVLFRNELPQGSSVHRRLASGTLAPADVGLDTAPHPARSSRTRSSNMRRCSTRPTSSSPRPRPNAWPGWTMSCSVR